MDDYCSERREFGLMTFEDALQKCKDEGLELPIPPSPEGIGNVLGYPDPSLMPWPPGYNTLGGLGIWLGLIETQHRNTLDFYWKRRGFKIINNIAF